MPTDTDRREVARRLRGDPCDTLIPYRTGIHFGMGSHEAANRFWDMCERIKSAGDYDIAYSTRSVLADLIEPPTQCPHYRSDRHYCSIHDVPAIDRDALLSLADEMESEGLEGWVSGPVNVGLFARRIREAVGA